MTAAVVDNLTRNKPSVISPVVFLAYTVAVMDQQGGYVQVKDAEKLGRPSTKQLVKDALAAGPQSVGLSTVHFTIAAQVIAWAKQLQTKGNDYLNTCQQAVNRPVVTPFDMGFLASLPWTYQRAMQKQEQVQPAPAQAKPQGPTPNKAEEAVAAAKDSRVSRWQGMVGEKKFSRVVKVTSAAPYTGKYAGFANRLVDDQGNVYTWLASSVQLEVGRVYEITGSVAAHETFRGQQQTRLTYCTTKLVSDQVAETFEKNTQFYLGLSVSAPAAAAAAGPSSRPAQVAAQVQSLLADAAKLVANLQKQGATSALLDDFQAWKALADLAFEAYPQSTPVLSQARKQLEQAVRDALDFCE